MIQELYEAMGHMVEGLVIVLTVTCLSTSLAGVHLTQLP